MLIKPDSLTSALEKISDDGRFKALDWERTETGCWRIKYMTVRCGAPNPIKHQTFVCERGIGHPGEHHAMPGVPGTAVWTDSDDKLRYLP